MASKNLLVTFFAIVATFSCLGGIANAVPVANPAVYSIPYASSYNAHVINHAIAAPLAASPYVAAPVAPVAAAYSAFPYAPALPYAALSAPLLGK